MIRSFRIFRDLVQTQSFSEAGRRNYLTQSAVSQHLKALEEKFGVRLIERGRRQVRLTRTGTLVYEAGQEILERYERLERALQQPPTEVSGVLQVATIYTVGLHELPSYMTTFLKRYPKVDLQLDYLKAPDIYEAVLAGRMDLGIVAYPKPHPQLHMEFFKSDRLILIVPPKHPWATRKRISLKQLRDQPFIAMQTGIPTRKAVDDILRKVRVQVNVVHAFDNIEIIKRAVAVGSGLSIVPDATVRSEVQAGMLKRLELTEGPFERPIGILTRKHAERSLAMQKFIDTLIPSKRSHTR